MMMTEDLVIQEIDHPVDHLVEVLADRQAMTEMMVMITTEDKDKEVLHGSLEELAIRVNDLRVPT